MTGDNAGNKLHVPEGVPAAAGNGVIQKPWKNFGQMRQFFKHIRERVGETRYFEELGAAGVANPGEFRSAQKALSMLFPAGPDRRQNRRWLSMDSLSCSVTSQVAKPLYAIEEYLAALVETLELVPVFQEQEFREEVQHALTTAVDKRDRVGQFMAHLEHQIAFAASEIERLRKRKAMYERAFRRIEDYVSYTIEMLGRDAKGKYRRLEGKTVTFSLAVCPSPVHVTDESAIPAEFKTVTLKLPAVAWEQILAGSKPLTGRPCFAR